MAKKVTLASASPRRIELLGKLLDMFLVVPANVEEVELPIPNDTALANSFLKGSKVFAESDKTSLVIGCDTVVTLRSKKLDKPGTPAKAAATLKRLRGKKHYVYTAVTIFSVEKIVSFCVKSTVKIKNLTDEEIDKYIEEYKPLDKAGAYGIQDGVVVDSFEGDYYAIVGLPVKQLTEILKEFGVDVK